MINNIFRSINSKSLIQVLLLAILTIGIDLKVNAQAQEQIFQTPGTYNWLCPPGVTSVTVHCYGAGGGGGTRTNNGSGGGGGGGAFASSTLTVVPGQVYSVGVGSGGPSGTAGGDSFFATSGTVMAKGGSGVPSNNANGAAGGQASASVGTIRYDGGNGGTGSGSGGKGGGGAGTTGPGENGGNGTANGSGAPIGGGNGGNGRTSSQGNGSAGTPWGGGGGGGYRTGCCSNRSGGQGANGAVVIQWNGAPPAPSINMPVSGSTTTCGALFYDSGGPTGNYGNNENRIHTFFPATPGEKVRVTFTQFVLETRNSCTDFWDRLRVFDGNSTSAPALHNGNGFWNTTCPSQQMNVPREFTSTAADGSLTFWFTSDGSTTAAGWEAVVECVPPPPYLAEIISVDFGSTNWCPGETRDVDVTIKNAGTVAWGSGINVGIRWNGVWGDHHVRVPGNGLASGQTATFTLPISAKEATAGPIYGNDLTPGTYNLSVDVVKEGCFWFRNNSGPGGACGEAGPGNVEFISAPVTIVPGPTGVSAGSAIAVCAGNSAVLNGSATFESTLFEEDFEGYSNFNLGTGTTPWRRVGTGDWDVWNATGQNNTSGGSRGLATYCGASGLTYCNNTNSIAFYTIPIDATLYTNVKLSFFWRARGEFWSGSWVDYGNVVYSFDGINWIDLPDIYSDQTAFQFAEINFSFVDGQIFYFGFRWRSDGSVVQSPGFVIDDIRIIGLTTPTVAWSGGPIVSGGSTLTPTVNPTSNTTYTMTATANGCSVEDEVTVTVNPAPTANAGPALAAICQGGTSAPMGGSVGGGATGGTWSGGAGTWTNANDPANATYTAGASESGVITLTLTTTGGCGAPVIATKTITVTPQRTVSTASVSPTACLDTGIDPIIHNTTGVTSIVSSTGLPTGVTASYSANQITISGVATQAGEFEYTITPDGCGTAVATGTITIVPYAARVAPLGPQCSGATLNFEAVINFPGSIYTWTVEPLPAGISASVTSGSASTFSTSITNTTGANFFATAPNHYISVIQTVNGVSCESFFNPTIHAPSTAPTSIDVAGLPYCLGGEATLTRNGGSLSTGANWEWFSASCGGTGEGTGTSIVVSPTSTTTYFVRASAGTACPASSCEQVTINTPAPNHALSSGATATCLVHQNGWVHFLDASGNLIASINSNGQNLGNVDAQVFAPGTPITGESCDSPGDALFFTEVMGRHWVITPQHQPTSNVSVRLPFNETTELDPLITSSQANQNPLDDVTGIGDLGLSKYSGPANVDGNLSNNCASAGGDENTTFHGQTGNGSVSSFITGHPANDRFVDFSISSFSEFWLHGSSAGSPLPVEFDQFSTVCTDDFVVLNWTTKSEVNASHWVIERSRDGWNWENIGDLNANGNTNATSHYEWKDPITGSNFDGYYRLQQVDFDGTATNYGPFHAQCNSKENQIVLNVYPNPAQDMVNLNFSIPQGQSHAFDVQLLNATGQTIAVRNVQIQQNNFTQTWETQQLNNGMYSFKICASNGECYLQKFVIHR